MLTIDSALVDKVDTGIAQPGQNLFSEHSAYALLLGQSHGMDLAEERGRIQPFLLSLLPAELEKAPQGCHPDSKELIEIGREYREEPDSLEQRDRSALGLLENPFVKRKPAQLPVDVALVGGGHTEADFGRILPGDDRGATLIVLQAHENPSRGAEPGFVQGREHGEIIGRDRSLVQGG